MPIPVTGSIVVEDEAVCLFRNGSGMPAWRVRWSEVTEVAAWKLDAWAFDVLCIGFRPAGADEYFYCDEHQLGWDVLLEELDRLFGLKLEDWWRAVVFPAFQENFTLLWRR
jgi:hypothetical protein